MVFFSLLLTIIGLAVFEIVTSIDNAVINAEVIVTLSPKGRNWFITWGVVIAVIGVRGILPWLIVWMTIPKLGPLGALTATFSSNPEIALALQTSAPVLLSGGGTFLLLLFVHWLFLEEKTIGLDHERFFAKQGIWFFASAAVLLLIIVKAALGVSENVALAAVAGSTVFFIVHGVRENAQKQEENIRSGKLTERAKLLYLEVIDAVFSIDGVLAAFAFTLSVPLVLLGNGLGAIVVRQLTLSQANSIKKYIYLKNGALYSICALGLIMILTSLGYEIPEYLSPLLILGITGFFVLRSVLKK